MKREYYNDYDNGTCAIKDFLESMGFEEVENSERYINCSYYDTDKGIELNVIMDFDPYMHIDETDDDINYEYPVYLYIQDWAHMSYWEVTPSPEYCRNLAELKSMVEDKIADDEDEDDEDEESNEQLNDLRNLWHEMTMVHS